MSTREENIMRARELWRSRQDRKRDIAERNEYERMRRSPYEQICMLDKRLGVGVGARKERARLSKILE